MGGQGGPPSSKKPHAENHVEAQNADAGGGKRDPRASSDNVAATGVDSGHWILDLCGCPTAHLSTSTPWCLSPAFFRNFLIDLPSTITTRPWGTLSTRQDQRPRTITGTQAGAAAHRRCVSVLTSRTTPSLIT